MRKMPAASGESSRPATSVGRVGSGAAAGGGPGELRKAAIRSMPLRAMRRSTCVVGGGPGVDSASRRRGLAGRLLAGDAQRPALVAVVDVPDPGERGLVAIDQRRDVAADPVGRGARARHHGDLARAGLVVERRHQLAEHLGRRPVDRFEGDRGVGRNARVGGCEPARLAATSSRPQASRASPRQRHRTDVTDALARRTRAGLHRTASTPPRPAALFLLRQPDRVPAEPVAAYRRDGPPRRSGIWSMQAMNNSVGQRDRVDVPAVIGFRAMRGAAIGIELRRIGVGAKRRGPRPARCRRASSGRPRSRQIEHRVAGACGRREEAALSWLGRDEAVDQILADLVVALADHRSGRGRRCARAWRRAFPSPRSVASITPVSAPRQPA